jgi:hypothetical protein
MLVSLVFLPAASQYPDLFIAGVIVNVFLQFTYQVPVSIIAALLRRMPMLLAPAGQLCRGCITAVIVLMPVTLLLSADKPFFITAVAMLMFFNTA